MGSSSRRLLTETGRREFPAAVPYTEARATPGAARPDWSSEFPSDEAPTRIDVAYDHRDQESWDAPPRDSVVRPLPLPLPLPLPPAPTPAPPARLGHWAVKLLLASALAAILALLGFALLSPVARELPPAPAGAQP